MADSNLARVAQWLAEEERKKQAAAATEPLTRIYRNDPIALHGVETADVYPDRTVYGRRPESDIGDLQAQGYEWRPGDEYATVAANPQLPVSAPKGKLPFISGTPTHAASKPAFAYLPPRNASLEDAMAGAAQLARPVSAPPPPAARAKPTPQATMAKARKRSEVEVRSTKEGVQPQLRVPAELPTPPSSAAALSPSVSAFLQNRRGPSGLEEAQRAANLNQLSANLGQSAEFLAAGVGGVRPRPDLYANLQEQAGQPVVQYRQRYDEQRQQQEDELALAKASREAARAAEEMGFKKSRATAEDQLAREKMAQEKALAEARLRGDASERGLRREEMLYRRKEGEDLKKQMEDQKRQDLLQRQDELDLQRLGAATSKAPFGEFQTALEGIDRLIPGLPYGVVPKEEPLGLRDRAARALAPVGGEFFMTDEGKAYATAISNLRDLISRMRSGAVLNAQEEQHYLSLIGDHVFSDKRSAAQGINAVRQGIAQKLRNAQAGFQNVLPRYESTGATTYRAPIFGAAPTGEEIQMPDGSVYEVLSDGTTRRRP